MALATVTPSEKVPKSQYTRPIKIRTESWGRNKSAPVKFKGKRGKIGNEYERQNKEKANPW
jgi:hypothetical protein